MALQFRYHCRKTLQNSCIYRFFSSSSNGGEDDKPPSSPSSSFLSSIKASLRQSSPSSPRLRNPNSPFPSPPPRPSRIEAFDEIRKNLSEFHRRSAPPSPEGHDASSPPSISFQDVYKRNVIGQGNADTSTDTKSSLASIRERLRQLRPSSPAAGIHRRIGQDDSPPSSMSLSALKDSLNLKPPDVSGSSSDPLRTLLFGREAGEAKTEADSQASTTEFVKIYSYGELGEKLKKLRPPEAESKKKKDWFSIVELNERLKKLREIEEKGPDSGTRGWEFKELRDSLIKLKKVDDAKARNQSSRLSC